MAQVSGQKGASNGVGFEIGNATALFASGNTAFNDIGGPFPAGSQTFDWGLPFFFGRNLFVAIEGQSTLGGPGRTSRFEQYQLQKTRPSAARPGLAEDRPGYPSPSKDPEIWRSATVSSAG